jgi:hypothetical protein
MVTGNAVNQHPLDSPDRDGRGDWICSDAGGLQRDVEIDHFDCRSF